MLQSRVLLDSQLLALPEADWETFADSNQFAGLAAAAIYGEGFEVQDINAQSGIIQAYNTNREQENRFGFSLFAADQSFEVAELMGLGYIDETVEPGKRYIYRLSLNEVPDSVDFERAIVGFSLEDTLALPKPSRIEAMPKDSAVLLAWSRDDLDRYYSSFNIERSEDNGLTYTRINGNPIIYTSADEQQDSPYLFYSDSLASNDIDYVYRIVGHTPFGFDGPPSDTAHVRGKVEPIGIVPKITSVQEDISGKLKVSWAIDGDFEDADIQHFDLYRAPTVEGPFEPINDSPLFRRIRQFTDYDPLPANYYKIVAVDKNGFEIRSFAALGQIDDATPPAAPVQPTCLARKDGAAVIKWEGNTEPDLMGYRVYASNQIDGEYMDMTGSLLRDTFFHFTLNLNTLSEEAYYKIRAVDYRENPSELSPACTMVRPDIIPPSPANVTEIEPLSGRVEIYWANSSSEDVVRHEVHRRESSEQAWHMIATVLPGEDPFCADTTAQAHRDYFYRIIAVDDEGLKSSSTVVSASPVSSALRGEITNLEAFVHIPDPPTQGGGGLPWEVDPEENRKLNRGGVALTWECVVEPNFHSFLIYRSARGEQLRPYKTVYIPDAELTQQKLNEVISEFNPPDGVPLPTVAPNTYYFTEFTLKENTVYKYRVEAQYIDGAVSPMSQPVLVIY